MSERLANWVEEHIEELVIATVNKMISSDTVRSQVEEVNDSVYDFFAAFSKAAHYDSPHLLNGILVDWIEARPLATQGEIVTELLPALSMFKLALWEQIVGQAGSEEAVILLQDSDAIFTPATYFLASLEAEALLSHIRNNLEKAMIDLARIDKRKSDFIAVAAHELKTPLTLVEGYHNMLQSMFPPEQHADIALMLDGVSKGAGRLREIIQDMIDVSMIDMALLQLHFQPVWIRRLIDAVHFDLRDKLTERSISIVVERDRITSSPTYADPERTCQVFYKVLSNAIKYTPDGGIITVSGNELPGFLDLTVTDNGIGISPDDLPHIFEKFSSQIEVWNHSSGKVKFKGAGPGLGLAIAQGIMEAHGGTIWAESEGYDEETCPGSTFHIMIPMRAAPPEDQMSSLFAQPSTQTGT